MTVSWPRRRAICLDCRTTHEQAGTCLASPRHRMTNLDTSEGREALLVEVWGPPSRRRRARELAKATGGGAAGGAAVDSCSGCSGCDLGSSGGAGLEGLLVVLVIALVIVVLYFAIKWAIEAWRRHESRLQPRGALSRGPRANLGHRSYVGTVIAESTAAAPSSGEPCVAYSVVGYYKRWRRKRLVMLRDGLTLGFDLALDNGERVSVPAGIIAIDMREAPAVDESASLVTDYLNELDPLRQKAPPDERDPLLHTSLHERVITPGMRVELHSRLEPRPDPHAISGDYREQAATVLVPVGVPILRVSDHTG